MVDFWFAAFMLAIAVMLWIALRGIYEREGHLLMPLSCPACAAGGDEDWADRPRNWYIVIGRDRYVCRWCHARFKERPDGVIGRDHEA